MKSRRTHAKSHFGCTQCKDKRVKCDESRPRCLRCQKRGSGCTYAFIVFQNPGSASKRKHSAIGGPRVQGEVSNFEQLNFSSEIPGSICIPPPVEVPNHITISHSGTSSVSLSPEWLSSRERELYRYYVEVVCAVTLSSSIYEGFSIWGTSIRQHAPAQPFLYSGMMSVASLHLALTRANGEETTGLLSEALHHQNKAISQYRGLLHNLSKYTLEPALAFAVLIMITAFARQLALSKSPCAAHDSIDDFINDIALFRGISYLHRLGYHQQLEKNLTPLLRDRIVNANQSQHVGESSMDDIQYGILSDLCVTEKLDIEERSDFPYSQVKSGRQNPFESFPPGRAPSEMYAFVVKKLRLQMRRMAAHPGKTGYILIWPTVLPNSYTAALGKRRPLALLLVAHWAAALHDIRDVWWIGDFGRRIVNAVQAQLTPEWQPYLQWPLEHIGMVIRS